MPKKNSLVSQVLNAITGKDGESEADREQKTKGLRLYDSAVSARKKVDWKWFLYDLWIDGHHYARWDTNTQQIISTVRQDGKPKVTINKVYTTLRGVRNYALRNRPRAEVTPVDLTSENIDDVVKLNKYLDFLHEKLHLRDKLKDSVWHALGKSVGWWQVLWNPNAPGGGEIEVNVIDPYDLYWDPSARFPSEASYVILAVRRKLEALREDPKYAKYKDTLEKMTGDNLMAASSMKARLLQFEMGDITSHEKEEASVIVKEIWLKEFKDGKTTIRIVTIAGDELIRNEETDLDQFPFFRLRADAEPLNMYGQGWVKNLIPANRLLNLLESSMAEYNVIMNKGKWIADKNAGVRVINNEHGQIIEKKPNATVTQATISPLSEVLARQIENANRYIEDIGAYHEATAGRVPTGVKSGRGIEALQVGDSNNMSEVVENIEVFLEDVYEYMLYLASQKYQFARNIIPVTKAGEREFIKIIGEGAESLQVDGAQRPADTTVIPSKNMVDVKVSSWLADTPEGRREVIKDLAEVLNAQGTPLDTQTILEVYETGSIGDIIKRMKQQMEQKQAEELAAEGVKNKMGQPAQAGAQAAIAAIRSIINGQVPPPPQGVGPEYIDYIDSYLTRAKQEGDEPDVIATIQAFRDQVVQMASQPPASPTTAPAAA